MPPCSCAGQMNVAVAFSSLLSFIVPLFRTIAWQRLARVFMHLNTSQEKEKNEGA